MYTSLLTIFNTFVMYISLLWVGIDAEDLPTERQRQVFLNHGERREAGLSAEASGTPSILSRRLRHPPPTHFQIQRL